MISYQVSIFGPASGRQEPRSVDRPALVLSALSTAALFSLLIGISVGQRAAQKAAPAVVVFSAETIDIPDKGKREGSSPDQSVRVQPSAQDAPVKAQPQSVPSRNLPEITPAIVEPEIELPRIELPSRQLPNTVVPGDALRVPGDRTTLRGNTSGASNIGEGAGAPSEGRGLGFSGKGSGGKELIATWAPSMNFRRLDRFFPDRARGKGIGGKVLLRCMVLRRDKVRDCNVVREEPQRRGFGKAALRAERTYRLRVHNRDGKRVYDEWVYFEAVFNPTD